MALIGIDLGTSNSLIAYWTEDGPKLIPNALGSVLTPSVVSVDDNGEIIVGQIAKERLITHPHVTAAAFKRFMGTEKKFQLKHYTFSATLRRIVNFWTTVRLTQPHEIPANTSSIRGSTSIPSSAHTASLYAL